MTERNIRWILKTPCSRMTACSETDMSERKITLIPITRSTEAHGDISHNHSTIITSWNLETSRNISEHLGISGKIWGNLGTSWEFRNDWKLLFLFLIPIGKVTGNGWVGLGGEECVSIIPIKPANACTSEGFQNKCARLMCQVAINKYSG